MIAAMSGVSRSLTSAATTAPNAPPMTTATARSMTLPRRRNCLNPFSMMRSPLLLTGRENPARKSIHFGAAQAPSRPAAVHDRRVETARARPDAGGEQSHLRPPVNPKIFLDPRVGERHRAERRQPQPGRGQAERLTQVAGFRQDDAVCAREFIFPLGAR